MDDSPTYVKYDAMALKSERLVKASLMLELLGGLGIPLILALEAFFRLPFPQYLVFEIVTLFFGIGIFSQVARGATGLESRWFEARAIAETAKSLAWQYSMRSGDFTSNTDADQGYARKVESIRSEFPNFHNEQQKSDSTRSEITGDMQRVRELPFAERKDFYAQNRLDNQINWYSRKAERNRLLSNLYAAIVILLQGSGVVIALIFFVGGLEVGPVLALLVATIASALAWSEARRYDELSEPYLLTARVLKEALPSLNQVADELALAKLVDDIEHAISREHRIWLLRRGLGVQKEIVGEIGATSDSPGKSNGPVSGASAL